MIPAKAIFFILLILAVVFEITGDVILKKWAVSNRQLFFIIGFGIYIVGSLFWAYSLRYEYLSKAVVVFTLVNLIAIVLVGTLIFKEELSFINKVGVGLAVVSIALIEL